ncbi:conserved hypothetical protein [uncultured Defluviicoccus sp.]|uniref:Uncharacterized protein n=1 Tax=metagenome TaxID=256318 RepID=A0A380TBU5_9ZZZZ|nr:conserved hypothetical protein [uncultured Defluviicoccus sp.]
MVSAFDRLGKPVRAGDHVRVLAIPPDVFRGLDAASTERVRSMVGAVVPVVEIDHLGGICVEKWWHLSATRSQSHGLTLASSEAELVATGV